MRGGVSVREKDAALKGGAAKDGGIGIGLCPELGGRTSVLLVINI
jgi:hypothetical protein